MVAHTAGEWASVGRTVYALQHHGWKKGEETFYNRFYADVQAGSGVTEEEMEANAQLMAAAPELLAALIEYIAAADNSMTAEDDTSAMLRFGEADHAARAAIAKAIGAA